MHSTFFWRRHTQTLTGDILNLRLKLQFYFLFFLAQSKKLVKVGSSYPALPYVFILIFFASFIFFKATMIDLFIQFRLKWHAIHHSVDSQIEQNETQRPNCSHCRLNLFRLEEKNKFCNVSTSRCATEQPPPEGANQA